MKHTITRNVVEHDKTVFAEHIALYDDGSGWYWSGEREDALEFDTEAEAKRFVADHRSIMDYTTRPEVASDSPEEGHAK